MPSFRLILEYDGRRFHGWQIQPTRRTVQGELEVAIARVARERVRAVGAGRTDAGVHAEGQVAGFRLAGEIAPVRLQRALNQALPSDVSVVDAAVAGEDFHARFSARGKLYRYRVWNHPVRSPLRAGRVHGLERPLDVAAMRAAAAVLRGRHDFASFQTAGSGIVDTVRTLRRLEIEGEVPGELRFWVEGDGFLRHMVRNLVGTLLEVGAGRRDPASLTGVLAARDRRRAGRTAPAAGLTLVRVDYAGETV